VVTGGTGRRLPLTLPRIRYTKGLMNSLRARPGEGGQGVGRAAAVADRLLDDIVSGRHLPGSRLPPEPELCVAMGVSRATLREAMKSLQQRGVTSIEQGRGTFVNPVEAWSPFDPVLLAARTSGPGQGDAGNEPRAIGMTLDATWSAKLIEARQVVEVGVAALAAARRRDQDLADMEASIAVMKAAGDDVTAFAQADLAFHHAVMRAAGNELIQALFDPISRLIGAGRVESSRPAERRVHALQAHASILAAIRAGDAEAATHAMQTHLESTLNWFSDHSRADHSRAGYGPADHGSGLDRSRAPKSVA
jgi:GntR family transcriptional repressor for pyruvate dehydrogenase complex